MGNPATLRVRFDASTDPSAATIVSQCVKLTANAHSEADLYASNNYPEDLTVWYNGVQIDCNVETFLTTLVVVAFPCQVTLQANDTRSDTDLTNYIVAWGNSGATLKRDLTKIYLLADDFASLSGSYTAQHCTAAVSGGVLTLSNATADPSGLVIPVPAATNVTGETNPFSGYAIEAYVSVNVAQSSWTDTGSRLALGTAVNGSLNSEAFGFTKTYVTLWFNEGGTFHGGDTPPWNVPIVANTWYGLLAARSLLTEFGGYMYASGGYWAIGANSPPDLGSPLAYSTTFPVTGTTTVKIVGPANNVDGLVISVRHLRVMVAPVWKNGGVFYGPHVFPST